MLRAYIILLLLKSHIKTNPYLPVGTNKMIVVLSCAF
jgi:hypothetical protein